MFNRWPRWIGQFEVCPIQLPGRENRIREPHYASHGQLADYLADELLGFCDCPFVFFGHCSGALSAYETARRLAGRTLPDPRRLVVSAQVAPHHCPHDRFLELSDADLRQELKQLVVARGGEPHPVLLDLTLDVLRKDLDANRIYRLQQPVPVPMDITVLYWTEDREVSRPELSGWVHYGHDVEFTGLSGDHYAFLAPSDELLSLFAGLLNGKVL